MVRPAEPAVQGSSRPSAPAPNKTSDPKGLPSRFQALVGIRAGSLDLRFGRLAVHGSFLTCGVEGAVPGSVAARRGAARSPGDETAALLEPLARSLAVPNLALASAPPAPAMTNAARAPDLAALEEAVRRISWGGDRRRGVARIELGGEYAGTAIVVRGEGREVAIRVETARGGAVHGLSERLVERLEARGLRVTELEMA